MNIAYMPTADDMQLLATIADNIESVSQHCATLPVLHQRMQQYTADTQSERVRYMGAMVGEFIDLYDDSCQGK